jgi:dTDP-glucose 4,6-dehydratase
MLVTGGAGFIGTNFIHYVIRQNPELHVVNLDALTYAGNRKNMIEHENSSQYTFVKGDIRNGDLLNFLFEQYDFDQVVHFAAESHVDRSIHQPGEFITTNVVGTFELLNAAKSAWDRSSGGKRFHYVSTDEIFGSLMPEEPPSVEASLFQPRSPYSASKAAGNHLAAAYFHTYGLPVTISNCTNNYGPYQYPEKLIPLIILNCLQEKPLPVYGDGQQIRDWLFVEDHCSAICAILESGNPGESYNIGGGNQTPNIDLIHELCEIMDTLKPRCNETSYCELITHVTDRPGHDRRYDLDGTKMAQTLNWQPSVSLKEGLERTVRWYLTHLDWLHDVMNDPDFTEWISTHY